MSSTRLRMRMADIADIAGVRRPVVTMWRKRPAPGGAPFPEPVESAGGETWFDADQIGEYLDRTGRGNNPTAKLDIAARATAVTESPADRLPMHQDEFMAVSALLALRAIDDEGFADRDRDVILDRADDVDPDDEFIFSELEVVGDRLFELAEFADRLVESSYSVAEAMENLMAQRFRIEMPGHREVALSADAVTIITDLVLALADQAGMESTTLIDPAAGSSDLLVAVAQRAEHRVLSVHTVGGTDAPSRLARRRLRAHGVVSNQFDADRAPAGCLYLARFPSPAHPDMSTNDILEAINDLAVSTSPTDRVVILAPASALTDRLASQADRNTRDLLLRTQRLRALVKLPVGLVPGKARQRLGLCCLGTAFATERGNLVAVGDLPDVQLTGAAAKDLAVDLAAVMTPRTAGQRAARYLHFVAAPDLLARRGALVTSSPAPRPSAAAGAELSVRIAALREALAEPIAGLEVPSVEVVRQPNTAPADVMSRAELNRILRLHPGHRLDSGIFDDAGTVRVVGLPELASDRPGGERRADRLALTELNPTAAYTEPGDIVFCSVPRPRAVIDPGGSVVESPARILRLDIATAPGLVPAVVAADINGLPPEAKNWKAWPLRRVAPTTAPMAAPLFTELAEYRDRLAGRIRQLDHLSRTLADGLTSGTITIPTTSTTGALSSTATIEGNDHATAR